jgi:hypothetical protein
MGVKEEVAPFELSADPLGPTSKGVNGNLYEADNGVSTHDKSR